MSDVSLNTSVPMMQATQRNAAQGLQAAKDSGDTKKIEESAKEFEAVFIAEMMKPMFEGIETDSMFGGGKGEEVFRGFLVTEYGKMMAESRGVGIADHVRAEMIRMQGEKVSNQKGTINEQ